MTPTPTGTSTLVASSVVVNEVAWGGTAAQITDEWIELYNPGAFSVNLTGWTLTSSTDGSPTIALAGNISPGGYFLLERTDNTTVSDIAADQIYAGDLGNRGEALTLRDSTGAVVDTANGDGGAWPTGSTGPNFYSMERTTASLPDSDSNWHSNDGLNRNGLDAHGNPINGTPRQPNSPPPPAPTPTPTFGPSAPLSVIVNEVAWAGTDASSNDEWIELHNPGASAVNLGGWTLTDGYHINIVFPSTLTIGPGAYLLLERSDDRTVSNIPADLIYTGGLSNDGGTLVLRDPLGAIIDTANADGGPWPGGDDDDHASMERHSSGPDSDSNWHTNDGRTVNGLDARGKSIRGTPRGPNSAGIVKHDDRLTLDSPPVPLATLRQWPDGAWATVTGRVTVPAGLFSTRLIYIQDETGAGLAVYLGRGNWPQLVLGQTATVLGYLRHSDTGQLQIYVRNRWLTRFGPEEEAVPVAPLALATGQIGEANESSLVTVAGPVVQLETQAFWIDDGSGPVRIFFSSTTGLRRPKVRRGEMWVATGIVIERTTARDTSPNFSIQPRFASDMAQSTAGNGPPLGAPTPLPTLPAVEPTETAEP